MKEMKPLQHTWTTGMLVEHLRTADPTGTMLVSLAGCLRIARVKRRGPDIVDIEAEEATSRDPYTGEVTVKAIDE